MKNTIDAENWDLEKIPAFRDDKEVSCIIRC
jgi:hypothetical protein